MKRAWKRMLAFLLVAAIGLNAVNMPVVYAQENTEAGSEYTKTEDAEKEPRAQAEEIDGVEFGAQAKEAAGAESETQAEYAATADKAAAENDAEKSTVETENAGWDQENTKKAFEGENYKVTFTLASHWDAGYNANIMLENMGEGTIRNWHLGFDYDNAITNIWNAEVSENDGKKYVIRNTGWNQDIAAGGSIEFGISGDHAFRGFPENYELTGTSAEVKKEDYAIEYRVWSDWGSGFTGNVSITNNTDATLEYWVLEFDFNREITEIWNGIIEEHEGNHYMVRNAAYNSTIAPGGCVSIGMKGSGGENGDEPDNYALYSYNGYKKTEKPEIDLNLDTDNDGAPDYIEDYFGTDKNKTDTDGTVCLILLNCILLC